jgi:hypothetical protein
MIKKILAAFLVCILILLSFSGCSNALKESNASLNNELTRRSGREARRLPWSYCAAPCCHMMSW